MTDRIIVLARELLYLYDWRPQLAKLEEEARTNEESREVKRLLREYGERKKAGWIALRAELDQAGSAKAAGAPGAESTAAPTNNEPLTVELDDAHARIVHWLSENDSTTH
jgi:hypothetical protein